MIVAGLILLAVGAADLVRQFVPRRWIGYGAVAAFLVVLGAASDAIFPVLIALAVAALWVWCMPEKRGAPAGFWPAVLLGALSVTAVVWIGERPSAGLIGEHWRLQSPFGDVPFDLAILVLGLVAFLLESANLVVRAALDGEHAWIPADSAADARAPAPDQTDTEPPAAVASATTRGAPPEPVTSRNGFKGGRLIGPLERIIVFLLTLAGAYPILAAMLAAKGIVRFPEISRDGETGARAEYFLVGSLVSWMIALGAAFLVWWSAHV